MPPAKKLTLNQVAWKAMHDIRLLKALLAAPTSAGISKVLGRRGIILVSPLDLIRLDRKLKKGTKKMTAAELVKACECLRGKCGHKPFSWRGKGRDPIWQ